MKNLLGSASAIAVALVMSYGMGTGAHAQNTASSGAQQSSDGQADPADATGNDAAPPSDRDDLIVVGSRIRRPSNYNSPEPITVLTREEATLAGFNSTTEALQSTGITNGSAQINNAFGNYVTNGGPGANTLSLRGLGAERTLILLNGRRVAPAGSRGSVGSADLNVLPTGIVERVEVLKSGASSVYGSDAVAGVVNIVTESALSGLRLDGQHNLTQDGGGESERYAAVAGYNSGRLHLSGAAEYYNRDELTLGDRDYTQCQTDYRLTATNRTPGSGDFIDPSTGSSKCYPITGTGDNGVTINTIGTSTAAGVGAAGSVGTTFNRFRPNSAVTTGVVGYEGVGGGSNNLNVRDTFEPRMLNQSLISPTENYTGFLQGRYETDMLGNAEIYTELLLSRRKSSQVGYRQLTVDYIKGSPLIPQNLQFSTFLPLNNGQSGSISTPTQAIGVRAFIGFGNYDSRQTVDYAKAGGGVRGEVSALKGWRYDLYASKTWSDSTYTTDQILTNRLAQSLQVVRNANGTFSCSNPAGGCVAAPALTADTVGGNLPSAWVNYIQVEDTGTTAYRESVVNLAFNGPLFAMPGGDVQLVVGGEYRSSAINDQPSEDSQAGNLYNFTSSAITKGSDRVYELFAEAEVPILRDVAGFYDLSINASGRYTNYRSYGGGKTYKLGAVYSPFKALTIRGTYGTSFRAPALFEQYLGATSGFLSSTNDPCNNYDAPGVNANRAANCRSEGLPAGYNATSSVTVYSGGGASTGLSAETSVSWSAGAILQPSLGPLGEISLAADYFEIHVNDGVSRVGTGSILSLCYDDPDFRSGGGFCNLVTRSAGSNVLTVNNNYVNLSEDNVRGIDITGRYSVNLNKVTLRLNAQLTKFLEQSSRLFATDPLDDYNGTLNTPDWTGTFEAAAQYDKFTIRYGLNWTNDTQSYDLYGLDRETTIYKLDTPDYFIHSLTVQVPVKDFGFTFGIRNLTDEKPPQISSGVYNRVGNSPLYSNYDYLGRQFFVNVTAKF